MAKWEGKASTTLTKANADQIWSSFIDFFNYHKWFPNMSTSYGVHGVNGKVGCIRYCGGFSLENEDGGVGQGNWAKERLVAVDPNKMSLSYEIVDSSFGLTSYLSTVKVVHGGSEGCVVEWSFTVDPVEGLTCEYLVERYQDILNRMTKKMEVTLVEKNAV